jgi:glycosyltransferase involved in cell wall biosynthesis
VRPDAGTPQLSVVIPLRDEEQNVGPLHAELTPVLERLGLPYELILVEDGSRDETFERLRALHAVDPRTRVIRFSRNFGQTAAFAAGFAAARGRFIVTFDGDLQNDPSDIPRMVELARTYDIVCGWRRKRKDAFLTRHLPSIVANWLLSLISGVTLHDNGCSLRVFRAEVVKPLKLRPGMHRYLPAIASQLGGRVTEMVVTHRPRRFGRSKYGLSRTFGVIADLIHLRAVMRQAVDAEAPVPRIYDIAEALDGGSQLTTGQA